MATVNIDLVSTIEETILASFDVMLRMRSNEICVQITDQWFRSNIEIYLCARSTRLDNGGLKKSRGVSLLWKSFRPLIAVLSFSNKGAFVCLCFCLGLTKCARNTWYYIQVVVLTVSCLLFFF